MKRKTGRTKIGKGLRSAFSFLLCAALLLTLNSVPAQGVEDPLPENEIVAEDEPSPGEAALIAEAEREEAEREEAPEETAGAVFDRPEPVKAADGDEDGEKIKVTFSMGVFGNVSCEMEAGQYIPEIPDIPDLPEASVLGWYDSRGERVNPWYARPEENVTYTARWGRSVYRLLNTDDHISYINGYNNGMFKPNNGVTRAEAAQMLYTLLRSKDYEKKSFTDIEEGKWYTEAIGVMAGLGIFKGYTDGTFKPSRKITRAEFVAIAVACDTLIEGAADPGFSDIKEGYWGAAAIATASQNGWINGYADGTFRPDETVTRAQAVTIINNLLGRSGAENVTELDKVKNFYDVFSDGWAYRAIVEASTEHRYYTTAEGERWTSYTEDDSPIPPSGWVKDSTGAYYLDHATGKFLRGEHTIDGQKYIFSNSTGAVASGWRMVNGYRRYFYNGTLATDISGLGVVSGPYRIKVYKNSNYLIVFAKDPDTGAFNTPVKAMRTSCGTATPIGTFRTPSKYRWLCMVGNTYAQWCTQIYGNFLLHSVPNWTQSNMDLEVDEYNHLGETRSMGCVRLNCANAKWIFDNCSLGTEVVITVSEDSGPLPKPDGIKIPAWHSWDPTDPTAYWRCEQNGCH